MKPYFQDEWTTIYNGKAEEVLPLLDPVDLTVTSPPYDNLRDYQGYSFDFETIAKELYRVTKPGGVVVWVVGDATVDGSETGTSFRQALYFKDVCGFNLHDTMIYERQARFPETNRYYPCFEYMFIFSKGKPSTAELIADRINTNGGDSLKGSTQRERDGGLSQMCGARKGNLIKEMGVRGNIWRYNSGWNLSTFDAEAFEHPAIFPEQLATDHIRTWATGGSIVIDPMMGSGTVAKMAKKNGNKFIGIEISERYCEIAIQRLRQEVLQFA